EEEEEEEKEEEEEGKYSQTKEDEQKRIFVGQGKTASGQAARFSPTSLPPPSSWRCALKKVFKRDWPKPTNGSVSHIKLVPTGDANLSGRNAAWCMTHLSKGLGVGPPFLNYASFNWTKERVDGWARLSKTAFLPSKIQAILEGTRSNDLPTVHYFSVPCAVSLPVQLQVHGSR
ncbi:unnamed protein product, partial [Protopolystoma xenopodis]